MGMIYGEGREATYVAIVPKEEIGVLRLVDVFGAVGQTGNLSLSSLPYGYGRAFEEQAAK